MSNTPTATLRTVTRGTIVPGFSLIMRPKTVAEFVQPAEGTGTGNLDPRTGEPEAGNL